jgi:hypothetical protein
LLQDEQISFDLLQSVECLYKEEYENDPMVRKLWYLVCYHFLPKINKDWKQCLEGNRILQPTFLYEKISTSDEALTLWLIKNWEPKMKENREKDWPNNVKNKSKKGIKQGEQELRAGLPDYIKFHTLISHFKDKEQGMVACRWSEIFWEELVARNPKLFKKRKYEDQSENINHLSEENKGEVIVLPGIDNNNNHQSINLLTCYNMRKALKTKNTDSNNGIQHLLSTRTFTDSNDKENTIQKENNNNGTLKFMEENEILNSTTV